MPAWVYTVKFSPATLVLMPMQSLNEPGGPAWLPLSAAVFALFMVVDSVSSWAREKGSLPSVQHRATPTDRVKRSTDNAGVSGANQTRTSGSVRGERDRQKLSSARKKQIGVTRRTDRRKEVSEVSHSTEITEGSTPYLVRIDQYHEDGRSVDEDLGNHERLRLLDRNHDGVVDPMEWSMSRMTMMPGGVHGQLHHHAVSGTIRPAPSPFRRPVIHAKPAQGTSHPDKPPVPVKAHKKKRSGTPARSRR